MKLYVITHKKIELNLPPEYKLLSVGAYNGTEDGMYSDQTGVSISSKNFCFCELTGLYWIWKNQEEDIMGLVHYRRFFYQGHKILSKKSIEKALLKSDIILPKKAYLRESNQKHYLACGYEKDLTILRDVLSEKYPQMLNTFDTYFNSRQTYYYNMMIAKEDLVKEYCSWLFDVLFEVEKRVDISDYPEYQKRIFGFMSERLLNVFVLFKNLKIKEYPVYRSDSSLYSRWKGNCKNNIKFLIGRFKR